MSAVGISLLGRSRARGAEREKPERTLVMDYGAFLSTSVVRTQKEYKPVKPDAASGSKLPIDPIPDVVAMKGIVIRVGGKPDDPSTADTLCFDTDSLRMAGGWTGGFLNLTGTMLTNHKGVSHVTMSGHEQFRCDSIGWGGGSSGNDFSDPRPDHMGPLPVTQARYTGLYVHGEQVVLAYRVGSTDVLELPGYEEREHVGAFTRTIRVGKSDKPLTLAICDVPGAAGTAGADGAVAVLTTAGTDGDVTAAAVVRSPPGAKLTSSDGHIRLSLPALPQPAVFKVEIWKGRRADVTKFDALVAASHAPLDPSSLCKGGDARWKPISTAGKTGAAAATAGSAKAPAYVVDTLTLPEENPWNAWMRLSGLDFFSDGRAAVCTLNGDVWIVSGINDALSHLTWTRFATGLYHPMGLRIVDDVVYVRGRDQITRLHDLNHDGEADFYENFNNEGIAHPSYHGFAFDLQTDRAGNFYYARGGIGMAPELISEGRLTKLSKDGSAARVLATGLRAPNGLGVIPGGAHDWVTVSDNEGNWIPTSSIHLIDPTKPVEFLGFMPAHHMAKPPTDFAKPMIWVPHKLDTSSGGEAYIDSERWGPFRGQCVHTSFGTASLMLLLPDMPQSARDANARKDVPETPPQQAAVVKLPLDFSTGIMRPRFNPKDGQLYACGLGGGWQTSGTADGGLYRVRYTGKPTRLPSSFHVVPHGVQLTFAEPLDRASAADEQDWSAECWNYRWSEAYGSPDLSAKNPGKSGHDTLDIKSAAVSPDGKTVTLDIPDLSPVMQLMIQCNAKAADGGTVQFDLYATVNEIPR